MKQGPLKGIKVLDFSQVLSAPFCGMMLADMGAEVIKVERPGAGDISREYGPYINEISLYFCQYNRGKKGIAIDMRSEEGKKVVMDLVAQADVVVENFKAGTLEKLGIGYEKMLEVNPNLIYGSISGFGTYGPLSHLPCMDIIAAARSGLVAQSGQGGDAPIKPGFSLCDTWAGLQLLRGLSMALLHRQRTGKGLRVDIAMLDCAFYMCESPVLEHALTGEFTQRTGNHHAWYAPYGEFAAKDGNIVLAVSQESQWVALCDALGTPGLASDPRFADNAARVQNRDALIQELERVTGDLGRYEMETALRKAGVPAAAVQSLQEFHMQPQTARLNVITQIEQDGVGAYTVTNTPIRFSRTPLSPNASAAGHPGEHSREILESLGYAPERVKALLASGAVHQAG